MKNDLCSIEKKRIKKFDVVIFNKKNPNTTRLKNQNWFTKIMTVVVA